MVPGDCRGWSDGDGRQDDFQVALHKLLDRQVVIFRPVPSLGEPHLFVGPLSGKRGVVGGAILEVRCPGCAPCSS